MAISDEQRAAVSRLALEALDAIEQEYGESADLGDAVLVYEINVPDGDQYPGGATTIRTHPTTSRATVVAGLLTLALHSVTQPDDQQED